MLSQVCERPRWHVRNLIRSESAHAGSWQNRFGKACTHVGTGQNQFRKARAHVGTGQNRFRKALASVGTWQNRGEGFQPSSSQVPEGPKMEAAKRRNHRMVNRTHPRPGGAREPSEPANDVRAASILAPLQGAILRFAGGPVVAPPATIWGPAGTRRMGCFGSASNPNIPFA